MKMLWRVGLFAALLANYVSLSCALETRENAEGNVEVKRNDTTAYDARPKTVTQRRKVKKAGSNRAPARPRSDVGCTNLGGVCQLHRYVCRGQYLKDKCKGPNTRLCCVPVRAWSALCAGQHNNRVRACDVRGCGAYNSRSGKGLHKAVDLVCDDYGTVNTPFSGSLAGPVSQKDPNGNQYDGIKLLNEVHCVELYNVRPYRSIGPVVQGEALGYVLPLQERFPGITSHLELRMCDGSDPSPFI